MRLPSSVESCWGSSSSIISHAGSLEECRRTCDWCGSLLVRVSVTMSNLLLQLRHFLSMSSSGCISRLPSVSQIVHEFLLAHLEVLQLLLCSSQRLAKLADLLLQ